MKRKTRVAAVLLLAVAINILCVPPARAARSQPHLITAPHRIRAAVTVQTTVTLPALTDTPQASTPPQPVAAAAPVLKKVTPADMRALDLRKPCGFTAEELESVAQYSLHGLGADFAAQDQKVNAVFLLSIAALESGWGRYKLTAYNLFGMYNYRPGSYTECISHVADILINDYLTQGGPWYNGLTVTAVNTDYCVNADGSPNTSWADQIGCIMADMYNQIYAAEYQQALNGGSA